MTLILSGTNGLSDVDGSAATPAIRGTDANTGIFFGADIIGFAEGGAEVARFNADAQFVAAAGTASLPVITTTGDVNTGIFFPAADTIAFSEGGVESMRIDSSGNVGIGTSSPNYRLDVQAATGTANISSTTGTNAVYLVTGNTAGNTYFGRDSSAGGVFGTAYATVLFSQGAYPMNFYTNSALSASITSAGLFQFNSGYGSVATAYGCRAWVNFNGTGTVAIRASGNVSSITDNGTGDYTVNFTTAMPDANYSVSGSTGTGESSRVFSRYGSTQTTAAVRVACVYPTVALFDDSQMHVAVFR